MIKESGIFIVEGEVYHPKLLYQETEGRVQRKLFEHLLYGIIVLLFGIVLTPVSFLILFFPPSLPLIAIFLMLFLGGIWCLKIGYDNLAIRKRRDRFEVYDSGIKFPDPKTPFLYFSDIDHIQCGYDSVMDGAYGGQRADHCEIYKKGEVRSICSFSDIPYRKAEDFRNEYDKLFDVIATRLVELDPHVPKEELVRGL